MEICIKYLLLNVFLYSELWLVSLSQSFFYEKMHKYGLGRKIIPNYRRLNYIGLNNRMEHPDPLPKGHNSNGVVHTPYHSIYQGRRMANDTRVFRRRFEFEAKPSGHQVFCEGIFDCKITHMAVETTGGIPILLRGGTGYHYLVVVVRAKPGDMLKGSVRAYCQGKKDQYYAEVLKDE